MLHYDKSQDKFYGDLMDNKPNGTIRIYSQNINGLQLHEGRGGKLADIISEIKNMDCDIFVMAEHNCNSWQSKTHDVLKATLKENFDCSKHVFASSQTSSPHHYKPGGTAVICQGPTVGRITQTMSDSEYGRWTVMTLRGKADQKVNIISAYQVCKANISTIGATTAYAQQYHLLQKIRGECDPCPRKHFIKDLDKLLHKYKGQEVILCGDFNEGITANKTGMTKIQQDHHLIDIIQHRHSNTDDWHNLNTYKRGSTRLDYVLCTNGVGSAIQACGYEAYNHRIISDHRGYFVDICIEALFPNIQDQMAHHVLRGIKSTNQDKLQKYIYAKNKYLEDHSMDERVEWLSNNLSDAEPKYLEAIDNDLTRASLHAEAEVRSKFRKAQWSVRLAKARCKANILKRALQEYRANRDAQGKLAILVQRFRVNMKIPQTFTECQKMLRELQSTIRLIVHQSYCVRHQEMENKAEKLASLDPKSEAGKILKRLIRAEKVHRVYEKLKLLRQGPRSSFLQRVKVPKDPTVSPKMSKEWIEVTNPEEVEEQILNYNKIHFMQAEGTPWTRPPLNKVIQDFTGTNHECNLLLEGSIPSELSNIKDPITEKILAQLKAKTETNKIDPLITVEAFEKKFQKWREATSTSPSGVHLGHYRALVRPSGLHPESESGQEFEAIRASLIHYHVTLLNSCIKTTHVLQRWKPIASIALEKDPGEPKIHRLRIIHIYEADYNFMLSNKWQEMIKLASSKQILNSNQHAAPKKTAILPVVMEELQYEITRTSFHPLARFDNDACACYDRILPGFGNLCSRRLGLHKNVAALCGRHLYQAQYRLKKGATTGERSYQHTPPDNPVYGTGQGAGNSPAAWSSISSLLFDSHSQHGFGATFISPNRTIQAQLHMTGYVDDSTISTNLDMSTASLWSTPDATELIYRTIQDGQLWHDLLWNAAGALALHKCSYHVLLAKFDEDGIFRFHDTSTEDMEINLEPVQLQSYDRKETTSIQQLQPNEAHRTLGCYKSPDGKQATAIEKLSNKCDGFASILGAKSLDRADAWIFYHAIYLPSVTYILPSSHFQFSELDKAQRKAQRLFFAQCGYNRNTKKEVLYGPAHRGGAGFFHLYDLQGSCQIETFLKLWRSPITTEGRLLRIALHWVQRHAGIGEPLLQDTATPLSHSTSHWILSLREYLAYTETTIQVDEPGTTPIQREHDVHLMDVAIASHRYNPKEIKRLNACRLYLNVCLLSDICNPLGTHIEWPFFYAGKEDPIKSATSQTVPSMQAKPAAKAWSVWQRFIRSFCKSRGKLRQKLGPWLYHSQHLHMAWPAYYNGKHLFVLQSTHPSPLQYGTYETMANVASSQNSLNTISTIPKDAIPAHLIHYKDGWTFLVSQVKMSVQRQQDIHVPYQLRGDMNHHNDWKHHILKRVEIIDHARLEQLVTAQESKVYLATDGSYLENENIGSYGWVLANQDKEILMAGNGPVYAHSGSSYRAELVAMVAALTTIAALTKERADCSFQIELYTDSQAALDRLTFQDHPPLCPEWDALTQIQTWKKSLSQQNHRLTTQYVKSHQDDHENFDNLSFPAQLNVLADQQASLYRAKDDATPVPFYSSCLAQLLSGQGLPITKHVRRVSRSIHSLRDYKSAVCARWVWPRRVHDSIDWKNFQMTRPTSSQAHSIPFPTWVKLCNRILPVGHKQNQYDPDLPHACPSCGTPHERYEHLFTCSHPARRQWRSAFQTELLKFVTETQPTDPNMADMLVESLSGMCRGDLLISYSPPEEYQGLWNDQKEIGFLNMFCGHLAQGWADAHHQHLQAMDKVSSRNNGGTWTRALIRLLHREWFKLWQLRNDSQHGIDQTQHKHQLKDKLNKAIRHLHSVILPHLPHHEQEELTRQTHRATALPDKSIQPWISLWTTNFEMKAKKYKAQSIEKTSTLLQYFPTPSSPSIDPPDDQLNKDKFPP